MEAVKEYFLCVIIAAVAAGLIGILAPDGNGVGKYVRFAASLAVIAAVCTPLRPAVEYLYALSETDVSAVIDDELEKYTERTNQLITEQSTAIVCETIKTELSEEFDIPLHECEIILDTEEESGEIRLIKVTVVLSGYSMWKDPKEIKNFVSDLAGCECEVILG